VAQGEEAPSRPLTLANRDGSLPIKMTRLLVSVRNAEEALAALRAGADLIDVKEPAKGSLGAPTTQAVEEVVATVAGEAPVSVALGELRELGGRERICLPGGLAFVKVGLAHCASLPDWRERWAEFVRGIPLPARPVAVIYADWEIVGAPEPNQVLVEAARLNCAAVLVDTCAKGQGTLLDYWTLDQLPAWIRAIQQEGMLAVLGGSLTLETVGPVAALGPDYVAVRGAVCRNGRTGPLDGDLVQQLARRVAGGRSMIPSSISHQ